MRAAQRAISSGHASTVRLCNVERSDAGSGMFFTWPMAIRVLLSRISLLLSHLKDPESVPYTLIQTQSKHANNETSITQIGVDTVSVLLKFKANRQLKWRLRILEPCVGNTLMYIYLHQNESKWDHFLRIRRLALGISNYIYPEKTGKRYSTSITLSGWFSAIPQDFRDQFSR